MSLSSAGRAPYRPCLAFTLIELVVVVLIVSAVLALVAPRLDADRLLRTRFDAATRKVAATMLWARTRAVTRRTPHLFHLAVRGREYWISVDTRRHPTPHDSDLIVRRGRLPEGMVFQDVVGAAGGIVRDDVACVRFSPQGRAQDRLIHVRMGPDESKTIAVRALDGSARALDGQVWDFDFE